MCMVPAASRPKTGLSGELLPLSLSRILADDLAASECASPAAGRGLQYAAETTWAGPSSAAGDPEFTLAD